ncbi:choice-of-anchor I family protein [Cruoricaptor ignavus]|uniref:Choice-of-anchor I family protein n=1 Tax=Cruoricaptor ignavus TaxID=1118202 RepID=A0A7M1T5B2_9FLAO|nr:choice-of-anchor I family protein [Cruoricaptor ignavus]QOR74477.1 choice-of-anchor I family protein [Cruoricaptor ignavus]
MKQNLLFKGLVMTAFAASSFGTAQTLVHYWNFNDNSTEAKLLAPNVSLVNGASIVATNTAVSKIDPAGGTKQNFDVENLNARNGDPAGTHLRFNDPIGGILTFSLPTTGYDNIVVKFATRRSGKGAGTQTWSYTTDGSSWTNFQTVNPKDGNPELITLDFTQIAAANNNPNFKLKVEFSEAGGGTKGNNRFDNFTLDSGIVQQSNPSKVSLDKNFISVKENAGTLNFIVKVENPVAGSVDLVLKPAEFNTAENGSDFSFSNQTINIVPGQTEYAVSIPIIDDSDANEQHAEYFNLELQNPVNAEITGNALATVYIVDNDKAAPQSSTELTMNYKGSFDPSGANKSSVEILAFHPGTKRLFAISAITGVVDIIDFSNPEMPSVFKTIDMKPYGGVTSVAVKNDLVAIASPNADEQQNGSVVFFNPNGDFLKQVTVGALPDMVTFSPDGKLVLTANEGEPNAAYDNDPEGTVSIIDISAGIANLSQSQVTTVDFKKFTQDELIAKGLRHLKKDNTIYQDIEPEYITITADSRKAFVTLQENNGIAEIDLITKTLTDVWGLGKKDMSQPGNGFDASDNNGEILIANWPVKSFYIPDAAQTYQVNGVNYIITANEGDEKEFSALNERTTVGNANYKLNPANFPQAEMLKQSYNLGRFRVTNLNGDNDGDGVFEEINNVGARSFSIFNADTKQLVFDSGDQIERITLEKYPKFFNSDHEKVKIKGRSHSKGPEPEGVALAEIGGKTFAFITLERVGGVLAYNVTNPQSPVFVDYQNAREKGDLGPEGVLYISQEDSGNGKGYVLVANEISGTISIYELGGSILKTNERSVRNGLSAYPNPVNQGADLHFSKAVDFEIYDMSGKLMRKGAKASAVSTAGLQKGIYIIKTSEGQSLKVVVK